MPKIYKTWGHKVTGSCITILGTHFMLQKPYELLEKVTIINNHQEETKTIDYKVIYYGFVMLRNCIKSCLENHRRGLSTYLLKKDEIRGFPLA